MTPKISIIIPVYNTETYLRECLDSVINQTLKDIEIIIVNDCSPDNSESIILEYLAKDPRIKYIKHDVNKSLLQARISGAKIAVGDYIFHVDSDDYLPTLDACQILANTIDKTHPDLIQFDIQSNVDWGNWFTPLSKTLIKDPQQIKDLYFNNLYAFNLVNRIIKRDLYLQSIESISQDLHINMAEDFLQCSLIMNLATSYIGIDHKLYYYRVNDSSIANSELTPLRIQNDMQSKNNVINTLFSIISSEYLQNIKYTLGGHVLYTMRELIYKATVEKDLSYLLSLFIDIFGEEIYLIHLFNYDIKTIGLFWKYFQSTHSSPIPTNKTIGLFDNNLYLGGGQKVSSLLIAEFTKRGYSIVLFTEEKPHINDFNTSTIKERIILNGSLLEKISLLKSSIQKYNLDLFIIQEYIQKDHLEIIAIIKTLNKKIIYCIHSNLLDTFHHKNKFFLMSMQQFVIYDAFICLYPQSLLYWRNLGFSNAYYLPNPLDIESYKNIPSTLSQNTILWVGRLEINKNPLAALHAFHKALPNFHDSTTKLLILGDGDLYNLLQQYIKEHNLQKNVFLLGNQNSHLYYSNTSLHISTSKTEAFPMVIAEAKSFGIPTLMFELPHIAFHNTKGLISIPQNDIVNLAQSMCELLNNPTYLKELGKQALESLEEFNIETTMDKWELLIQAVYKNQTKIPELEIIIKESDTVELFNIINNILFFQEKNNTLTISEQQLLKIYFIFKNVINKLLPHGSFLQKICTKLANIIFKILRKSYRILKYIYHSIKKK